MGGAGSHRSAGSGHPGAGDIDWDAAGPFGELGRINDLAYGHAEGEGIAAAMTGAGEDIPIRLYRARHFRLRLYERRG